MAGPRRVAYLPALLWVLRDNGRARRFYDCYGFRPDGATHAYQAGGATLPEVRYSITPAVAPPAAVGPAPRP